MALPALRSKNYQLYLAGSFFALNSFWISRVIVGWLGWELTHSAFWVGILSFFLFVPTVVMSPIFGVLSDRVELRRAGAVAQTIVVAATSVLYALHVTEVLTVWSLAAIALVIGTMTSADRSIRMTLVPRVIDMAALTNAVALYAINFNTARLIGPAVGGLLIDQIGTGNTILLNIAVSVPFIFALLMLKLRPKSGQQTARQHLLVELWDGARHAARHPLIREAMVLTGVSSMAARGALEILPVIADGVFQRGAEGLGQMLAAGGAGALFASVLLALARSRTPDSNIPIVAHFTVFIGVAGVGLLGIVDVWPMAIAIVALIGFSVTMTGVSMQSTIQLKLDDTYRGRVMSLWIVVGIGSSATGSIILGTAADIFGISATLVGAGIVAASIAALFRIAIRLRKQTVSTE